MAKKVGFSQAYIARIENGTLDPKLSIVESIIDILSNPGQSISKSMSYYLLESKITCNEIMTEEVETIGLRDPITSAARMMTEGRFSHLPDLQGTVLVGSISQRDIISNIELNLKEMTVEAIMDPEGIPMVNEKTPVLSIIPLLQIYHGVIVQKQGRLSGIITTSDLLRSYWNYLSN